jgi:hypothetical protein
MPRRNFDYNRSSAAGIIARAGRAHEDPDEMTVPATMTRMAKYVARAWEANPSLTPDQAARAGYLLLRADMARLNRKSAEARAAR